MFKKIKELKKEITNLNYQNTNIKNRATRCDIELEKLKEEYVIPELNKRMALKPFYVKIEAFNEPDPMLSGNGFMRSKPMSTIRYNVMEGIIINCEINYNSIASFSHEKDAHSFIKTKQTLEK